MQRFTAAVEILMFVVAAITLGYLGWVYYDEHRVQEQAIEQIDSAAANSGAVDSSADSAYKPIAPLEAPFEGTPVGEILIPRVGVSVAVLEGTGDETLRHAVGHINGTAEPGAPGNICLAGHRDTFFRPLRKVVEGDVVTLKYPGGSQKYRVEKVWTTEPTDTASLQPSGDDTLTLVTCYPFKFIGSAPERFIVRARAVRANDKSAHAGDTPPVRDTGYDAGATAP